MSFAFDLGSYDDVRSNAAAIARRTAAGEMPCDGRWPEERHIYRERSAIHFLDRITAPVILFQGLEDKIVPPNQAELIVDALRKKGLPVAYIPFEGEQHGFRIAKNIKRSLEGELYFYSQVFGFTLADPVEPVPIDNLKQPAGTT